MRRDDAVTEIIGFVFILMLVITAMFLWTLIALPDQVIRSEESHLEEIQLDFGEFKTGVDALWLANNTGVIRKALFGLSPGARITESSVLPNLFGSRGTGTLWIENSGANWTNDTGTQHPIYQLHYRSTNQYIENIDIIYVAGAVLVKMGYSAYQMVLLPPSGADAVIPVLTEPPQSISGDIVVTAEYQLNEVVPGTIDDPSKLTESPLWSGLSVSRIAVIEVDLV